MADTALAMQLFMSGDDDIIVKENWKPIPGQPMAGMANVCVGKQFGAGALSFNTIFDLVDQQGKTAGQAIKVCKPTLAARRSLAHEWRMFRDLSLLADEYEAARSHYLQAHRVVRLADGRIAGIVMEKANGQPAHKALTHPHFCNVRYVIALLRDLLVGLDVAQRVLGFTHYDLKLDNVIEQWDSEASKARVLLDAVPQFKIFDFGTAVVYPDPFSMHNAVDDHLRDQRPDAAPQLAEQHPHNRRGKVTPDAADRHNYEYSTPFCCVRLYHMWWRQRGDVFRVLSALCRDLDDRTWPLEDIELVSLLLTVLEHATAGKRLKARFEPRASLLQRLYGPHPPPPAPAGSGGLSRAQTAALMAQHSAAVLRGSSSSRAATAASQGSSALPSAASIEAYGRQQQQQQQQRAHKQGLLQGVAEAEGEGEEQQQHQQQQQRSTVKAVSQEAVPPLSVNTTKIPATTHLAAAPAAASSPSTAGVSAGGSSSTLPPPSPTAEGQQHTPRHSTDVSGGGQYTPRRSTEVRREELNNSVVPGLRYVMLAKAAEPPAAAAAAAAAGVQAAAERTGLAGCPAPPSPFAGYGQGRSSAVAPGIGSSAAAGGNNAPAAAGGVTGVRQMVKSDNRPGYSSPQQQRIQQQQQQGSNNRQDTSAAVDAATKAAAAVHPDSFVVAAAPEGVPDPFVPPPPGISSNVAPELRSDDAHQSPADPGQPHRLDSAGTIVAKQPVASAGQQSVLGSRKALRGVTAQQLLVEPVIQNLLSKV